MIELHFHHELYDGFAVDEAAKVYGPYATMDLVRETGHDGGDPQTPGPAGGFVVRVTISADAAAQGIDERTLAAELANYALGLTVEKQGAG